MCKQLFPLSLLTLLLLLLIQTLLHPVELMVPNGEGRLVQAYIDLEVKDGSNISEALA